MYRKIPLSFKLKLILGGSCGSGKTTFLQSTGDCTNNQCDNDFYNIGVSFKPIECLTNQNEDSYKFLVWDLKARDRFKFLYPLFCRGTCAALLCFDTSNMDSFKELAYWINIIRSNKNYKERKYTDVPIILIGTKTDIKTREVSEEDVEEFMGQHNIDKVFYSTMFDTDVDRKRNKEEVFKFLIRQLFPNNKVPDCHIFSPIEDENFVSFLNLFSQCPICKRDNHLESLKSFFYSKNPETIALKRVLLNLIDDSEHFDAVYYNKISLGIPCCTCYKKIFDE